MAAAAALGVTEPYSAGVGGGGFLVYYEAATGRVHTVDGRETAPSAATENLFLEDGTPIPFAEAVTSGLGVGVPGTPLLWQHVLDQWGRRRLDQVLRPARELAEHGFVVDQTFQDQTAANAQRFAAFPATRQLFLPGGAPPAVGSVLRNPDLAATYALLADKGPAALYQGEIGRDLVAAVRRPPVDPAAGQRVRPGLLTEQDLRGYRIVDRAPTHIRYRGLDVYGMAPPASGGTTVGEALNILEHTDLAAAGQTQYLHHYLEASRLAFADRNRWVGDPAEVDVPTGALLSQRFAATRACLISPGAVLASPAPAGDPRAPRACQGGGAGVPSAPEGPNTTHLTVADQWGNVVAYTLTIEQTGGSGIVVPGRGFLLNNELTDFSFTPVSPGLPDPNLPGPGKRPRSSMAPTVVLAHGRPVLALGSPGGATIISTVTQVLLNRLDRRLPLAEAIAAPRASQRNAASTEAEPGFLATPAAADLGVLGGWAAAVTDGHHAEDESGRRLA